MNLLTAVVVIALGILSCGESVQSPIAPKVASDPSQQCVVVNVTGDNIQVHGASDVNIDTVAVSTIADTIEVDVGFNMLALEIGGYGDNAMDWNRHREGWEYWHDDISPKEVAGVFMRLEARALFDDPDPYVTWRPFDQFAEAEGLDVTVHVSSKSIFISDPDESLERTIRGGDYVTYYLGVVIFGG